MPVIARAVVLLVAVVACRSGTTAGGPQPEAGGAGGAGGGVAHAPSPSRRKRGRDGVAGETGVDAGTAASGGERAAAKGLESARCRKNGCCATEIWSVGRDRKGRQLAVVALETNK